MKRKEIALVVILILFGLLVQLYESGEEAFFRACSTDYRTLRDREHPHDIEIEGSRFEKIKSLEITNLAGEIRIDSSPDRWVTVQAVKRIFHKRREKVAAIQEKIEIHMKSVDGVLTVAVGPSENFPYHRARILFSVSVPPSVELKLGNRYGDIIIRGRRAEIQINGKYGDIDIRDIHSHCKITHGYGQVVADSVQGKLELETRYSKARIKDARSVRIRGRHTHVQLSGVKGDVNVANSHDRIFMRDIKGNIRITGRHCPISLRNIDSGYLSVGNSYHDVNIENLWAREVDLSVEKGDLKLNFFEIDNQLTIRNKHSDISLIYSKTMKPSFSITLTYGEIQNKTPLQMNIIKGKINQKYTGGEGIPKIIITNKYGNVVLRHWNRAAGE